MLFIIFSVLSIVGFYFWYKTNNDWLGWIAIPPVLLLAVYLLFTPFEIFNHITNISVIQTQDQVIQVEHERIASLKMNINELKKELEVDQAFNMDSPIATMIESIADSENRIADAKRERIIAERQIIARKLGPWSAIPWLYSGKFNQ